MDKEGFMERFRSLMERKNNKGKKVTSYYLAKNIEGISSTAVDKYLSGKLTPGPDKIKLIADFFNVSPGWLLFGEQEVTVFDNNITVPTNEMWDVLKASVYNQNAQNDHISRLLDMLGEKIQKDKKGTSSRAAV